jgi:hypothetical protein
MSRARSGQLCRRNYSVNPWDLDDGLPSDLHWSRDLPPHYRTLTCRLLRALRACVESVVVRLLEFVATRSRRAMANLADRREGSAVESGDADATSLYVAVRTRFLSNRGEALNGRFDCAGGVGDRHVAGPGPIPEVARPPAVTRGPASPATDLSVPRAIADGRALVADPPGRAVDGRWDRRGAMLRRGEAPAACQVRGCWGGGCRAVSGGVGPYRHVVDDHAVGW